MTLGDFFDIDFFIILGFKFPLQKTRQLGELGGFFSFFIYLFLFIYLAALGLSSGMQDLQSSLWHAASLDAACNLLVAACGI